MLAGLKAKLGPLSSNFTAPADVGAGGRGVAIRSPDHVQGPKPRISAVPGATANGASSSAAAAGVPAPKPNAAAAATAAAAMQLDRFNTWRNSLILRFSSGGHRTTTTTVAAAASASDAGLGDHSDGTRLRPDASGGPDSPAAAVAIGLCGLRLSRRDDGTCSEHGGRSSCSGEPAVGSNHDLRPREASATATSASFGSGAATAATAPPGGGAAATAASGRGSGALGTVTHLIVMANGLFGSPSNWSVICEQLREHLDMSTVVLHPSKVNRRTDTYDGIDVCGQRLADEIRSVAAAYPSLQRISVIGHSMGGLLLRYAVGVLYNPATGRVAGLRPVHFISLATPHMGCDAEGLAQVPFIGWMSVKPVQKMLQVLSVPTASLMFRRTGRQFFLADGSSSSNPAGTNLIGSSNSTGGSSSSSPGGARGLRTSASSPEMAATTAAGGHLHSSASMPLLLRMTQDDPSRGMYFYSALASFASRTAYANTDGDHLVGWANSSLRFMHQLPRLPPEASTARGVVLQDPLKAAFDVRSKPDREPQSALDTADVPIDLPRDPRVVANPRVQSESRPGLPATSPAAASGLAGGGSRRLSGDGGSDTPSSASTAAVAELMLRRLQRLPWQRIDVSFKGAVFGFAHNNIQVTRRWLNFEGIAVAHHLARQVVALEGEWARMQHSREGSEAAATSAAVPAASQPQQGQRQAEPPRPLPAGEMVVATVLPGDGGGFGAAGAAAAARLPGRREQEPLLSEAEAAELVKDLGDDVRIEAAAAEVETAAAAGAELQ